MGYVGEEGRVVSSFYLFNMLQDLYTKIKKLLNNKADVDHTHDFTVTDADTVDGYHADEFQKNINIHSKIDLKSGSFYDCILGKINEGFRGGKIEINDYCPSDTCNGNYWGFVEWTCNENRFAHLVFYTDRWEVIYVREISFNEETDTGWQRIGEGCNSDTLDGYHASNFLLTSGGTLTGNVLATASDTTERHFQVNNSLHNGHLCASTAGNFGLYSNSHSKWLVKCDTSGNVTLNGTANSANSASSATNATTATNSNSLNSTGFGNGNLTYYQTSDTFDGNTGWCHYLISNHGSGESYYHYTIGLPFWSTPIYQRQTGTTDSKSGWHTFYTTENITYGTSALTAGSSSLTTGSIYLQYE